MQEAVDCQAVQEPQGRLMQGTVEHLTLLLMNRFAMGHWTEAQGLCCW